MSALRQDIYAAVASGLSDINDISQRVGQPKRRVQTELQILSVRGTVERKPGGGWRVHSDECLLAEVWR